jgi:hypothetical protein
MTRTAAAVTAFLMMFGFVGSIFARAQSDEEQLRLGRAALAARDPAEAIRHFEQAETGEAREWLAVALMMESRSPSDRYVERAFESAMRARARHADQAPDRADLAAAMHPGDLVIAFLIGEAHAYAWAFDRDAFVGYRLPAPAEIATAAARARAYIDAGDRAGVRRIAEDLMPALLGPALERLPKVRRLIVVVDGPLRDLPIGELPAGEDQSPLRQQLAVSVVLEPGALGEAITSRVEQSPQPEPSWQRRPMVIGAIVVAVAMLAGLVLFYYRT